MLARIINERGLAGTSLGTLSLTAGAFDDAAAWCVLAIVLATFGGALGRRVCWRSAAASAYALFMIFVGRGCSRRWPRTCEPEAPMSIDGAGHRAGAVLPVAPS